MTDYRDYKADVIQHRQELARNLARLLGLTARGVPGRFGGLARPYSGQSSRSAHDVDEVPKNLCQWHVAAERQVAKSTSRVFRQALNLGEVHFVTICRPEWTCGLGELSADLVRQVVQWVTRRSRNLSRHGQHRVLGFVDIAWNDRSSIGGKSHWSVHAHIVVAVDVPEGYRTRALLRKVFNCRADGDLVAKAVMIKRSTSRTRVRGAIEYCSRALLLDLNRRRCSYINKLERMDTADRVLRPAQEREYARFVSEVGPKPFWILSGLRRQGDKIVLHNTNVEPRADKRYLPRSRRSSLAMKALALSRP